MEHDPSFPEHPPLPLLMVAWSPTSNAPSFVYWHWDGRQTHPLILVARSAAEQGHADEILQRRGGVPALWRLVSLAELLAYELPLVGPRELRFHHAPASDLPGDPEKHLRKLLHSTHAPRLCRSFLRRVEKNAAESDARWEDRMRVEERRCRREEDEARQRQERQSAPGWWWARRGTG